ncbi:hypothetical protein XM38_037720 [Halomicronema hongdechloris C2206]|uniref:DUF4089 domain-containing protein n=1 Tax=Halomicronema hongdechloris C2206 TaxID=1641165 RepID=A0A1Z3HR72_9CYAN|nr:DUF4089 domain-containing protein [Halomicronema hongdechloris]ASC72813.1 hypothetical protein XM38_037720 [Halomicronema hongdechloris C2206]
MEKQYDSRIYVEQMALMLGLSLPPDSQMGVIDAFEQLRAVAQPVLNFPLPDDLEVAPIFEP